MRTKMICLHCGHHFDGDEIVERGYDRATGTWDAEECPNCGSEDFEEAAQCSICGDWHLADKLTGGVCEECLNKYSTIKNAIEFGEARRAYQRKYRDRHEEMPTNFYAAVFVNEFLAHLYGDRVNEILMKQFQEDMKLIDYGKDARNYITDDPDEFSQFMNGAYDDAD